MPKKAPALIIEEKPGNQYPSLEAAQKAALSLLSTSLKSVIRELIENGVLEVKENKIIPKTQG